jgi:hypothetical protein
MKSISILLLIFIIVLNNSDKAWAQSYKISSYDSLYEKSQLRIGLRYTSDYVYMGRSDSAKAPYLSPSVSYYHKSGFFVRSSLSYLTAKGEGRIDMITLSGGYEYYKNNFALGASVSEYFFSDLSYNVMAEMTTYLNAYIGYDFSLFMIYGDASLGMSEGSDLFAGVEINRTFYLLKSKLLITPSVYMNAGSQQYYSEYINYRSAQTGSGGGYGKGKGGGTVSGSSTTPTTEVVESNQFKILDYEAGLMATYKINNIRLFASSTWTFPVNPATLVNDQGEYQEKLKNGFFWSSGIRIIF